MSFKSGDKVRRKAEFIARNSWAWGQQVLTVSVISGKNLYLTGVSQAWDPNLFELVKPESAYRHAVTRGLNLISEFPTYDEALLDATKRAKGQRGNTLTIVKLVPVATVRAEEVIAPEPEVTKL